MEEQAGAFKDTFLAITNEVGKVIVGQRDVIEQTLIGLFAGGHVLIEGVPGLGKTRLVQALNSCLDLQLSRIQFTPDLMPGDIIGTQILVETPTGREFRFERGPIFGQIVLADEINRATPKTQSALLEAMQETGVTVRGVNYSLGSPFFVMATQNPIEIEGTYALPEAQLDRFLFKLNVTFPSASDLEEIIERTTGVEATPITVVADAQRIEEMKVLVREIPVPTSVRHYVVQLILATHPNQPDAPALVRQVVRHGASPRAAQALILGAKVNALLQSRFNVSISDIDAMLYPALRHRLILNFEGEAEGISSETLIEEVGKVVSERGG